MYVGRMAESKGVPQILAAWMTLADRLNGSCPPLWLVGGTPTEIELIRGTADSATLARHEREGQIRWWGYLDEAGISTLLLKAFVLVTHSRYEPGGRVILEALAHGVPVIATPHGFARELVADWHTGFLVNYGDIETLTNRMAHFAAQPLLKHAMTAHAQRTATNVLNRWDFVNSHLETYEAATTGGTRGGVTRMESPASLLLRGPRPQGIVGVYPFEGQTTNESQVFRFAADALGDIMTGPDELPSGARSRFWSVRTGEGKWFIKNPFSTYVRRSIWDGGYDGQLVVGQRHRLAGEQLGAQCGGAAPLTSVAASDGLLLRPWLEAAAVDSGTSVRCIQTICEFHSSPTLVEDVALAHTAVDLDWAAIPDDDVGTLVRKLDDQWVSEEKSWNAWRPSSVRLGWRLMQIGLKRRSFHLSEAFVAEVESVARAELTGAAIEEPASAFGLCHGDCNPVHFRRTEDGELCLVDCERIHPGYFGSDVASFALARLKTADGDRSSNEIVDHVINCHNGNRASRPILWSWLRWTVASELCRTAGLMDAAEFAKTASIWRFVTSPRLKN